MKKVTQIACKISIETRPQLQLEDKFIKKKLSPSLISQSYDQYYCVKGTGMGWREENRKKALVIIYTKHSLQPTNFMCGSRGGTGGPDPPPPLKNHKNIGSLSNTGPDPLKKNHKSM